MREEVMTEILEMGLDDRAASALQEAPPEGALAILNEMRSKADSVRNPSAYALMAAAKLIKAGQSQPPSQELSRPPTTFSSRLALQQQMLLERLVIAMEASEKLSCQLSSWFCRCGGQE
eukprot:TRINITY_DN7335_c0_g3_i2.p1 TRINITY_DN7335_c0_g3~~TRINITY_DN7335_c0_g3_i2.p1  ORF type:complete len:119 (+),score=29.06 TRINITY_DN7335_c0_g3_i2:213-569(+)